MNSEKVYIGAWDGYDPACVEPLVEQVQRQRFDVEVITERPCDLAGWWSKLGVLASYSGMWLDADTVLTAHIGHLFDLYGDADFAAPANWAKSGWGGVQSSVMLWNKPMPWILDGFNTEDAHWPPRSDRRWDTGVVQWGDQEYLHHLAILGELNWTKIAHPKVCSYKYHCRGQKFSPDGCVVVSFHGKPKPSEVQDIWVTDRV
jgi:hypothetical protein